MAKASIPVDSRLVKACLKGDADSWGQLIRRYERLVYSVARVLCPQDAPDVFQQVCLELYERLADLRDEAALPKWLITVTRRKCYAVLRNRREEGEFTDESGKFSSEIDRIERQHALESSLAQLSSKCQDLIRFLYHEELSYADAASRLKIPVSSIGPTRARCLSKLKQMLE